MQFYSRKILLFFIFDSNLFRPVISEPVEVQRWCSYKFYTDPRSWFEAKAICEKANMTLARIHITDHSYIWSLIPTELSQLYTNIPTSAMWLDGYWSQNGKLTWQDPCEINDESDDASGENGQWKACMKMVKNEMTSSREECTEGLPFLCQGSTSDISDCYTITATPTGLAAANGQILNMQECYRHCSSTACYGIKRTGYGPCTLLTTSSDKTLNKGTCYVKDLVRTAPLDVYPSITELSDVCPSSAIPPSNQQDDIIMTSLPHSDTTTLDTSYSMSSSLFISEPTGHIDLQPSSTSHEPDETNEMTTPFLPNDITSVNLETSSLPTAIPEKTEAISPTRSSCFYTKTTVIDKEELEERVKQLRKELLVDKKKLSSWKRTVTSASDDRQSAASIGYVGVLVICLVPLVIIALDMRRVIQGIKDFRARAN